MISHIIKSVCSCNTFLKTIIKSLTICICILGLVTKTFYSYQRRKSGINELPLALNWKWKSKGYKLSKMKMK